MNFQMEGKLIEVFPIQQVTETFRKREFVIEVNEEGSGKTFTQYIKFQLIQDKCDIIDNFKKDQQIKVNFAIRGNRWEKEDSILYFTNLDAWRIEPVDNTSNDDDDIPITDDDFIMPENADSGEEDEDLPF